MYKIIIAALCVLPLFCANPGIVIGIPLPYDIPNTLINLPYPLQSFTIESAEFTNVQIKQLTFSRTRLSYKPRGLIIKECLALELEVSYMRIHFDFEFENSSGPGNYEEAGLSFYIEFDLADNAGRPEIQIKRIQMDTGKIKVSFGGSVTDRIISILTNFLVQPGEPIIHNQLKKIIKKEIDALNKKLTVDFKLLDVMLDASLVSAPNIQTDFVSINLNGAAYSPNAKPTQLNPPELLKVDKSRRIIQMLIHQQVLNSTLACEFKTVPLNKSISTMNITSTIDINSDALTPLFPAMISYSTVQDILLRIRESGTALSVTSSSINLVMSLNIDVDTNPIEGGVLASTPYINSVKGVLSVNLNMLFGMLQTGVTITKLDISSIYVNPSDVTSGKVNPDALIKYIPVLAQWIASGVDGSLNTKTRSISPYGIGVAVGGVLKQKYIAIELMI